MNEKNVVLLGESHFAFKNGITQGILDTGFKCFNLSLGGTPSLQNLYELIRNKKLLENADLIITGSNTHDIAQYNSSIHFQKSYQVINWLYKELYFLKKKIICFIAPTPQKWLNKNCVKYVNTLHIKLAIKYGFNVINANKKHLESSYSLIQRDEAHDFDFIMRELGRNIGNNIENFSFPKKINIINDNPQFYFYPIEKAINLNFANFKFKQSWLCSEKVYCIKSKEVISFNKNTFNLNLLGIHLWNDSGICEIQIKNPKDQIFNRSLDYNFSYFFDIYDRQFKITNDTKILNNGVNNINLISFFLASPEGNYHTEEIDLEALANENIEIPKEYNFNHLIPPIELYKEIIDEYCSIMDPRKLAPLQNQIKEKDNIIFTLTQEKQNLLNEKNNLENKLNSIPIKKQRLELANLEQDL
ncbi:alpha-2,3-sialyltransferase, partial [Campylobacter jejuni]